MAAAERFAAGDDTATVAKALRVHVRSVQRWRAAWAAGGEAALACYKPGERSRLIYRPAPDRRSDGRKSFAWTDYSDLLTVAHSQLGGPIVLVWDNLNTHLTAGMRQFIAEHDWPTVVQLSAYAPQLNPVEGIWSLIRRALANTAFTNPEHMIASVRRSLREVQHQTWLIDGALTGTGLTLTTSPFEAQ